MKVFNIERTLDEGRSPDFDHVLMLVAIQLPDESLTGYVIEQVAGNVWDWAPEVQHDEKHDVLVNDGRGSVLTMAEHEHVHLHGKCIKNRYGVACAAPTGRPEHERE